MLNKIIQWSLNNRLLVIIGAGRCYYGGSSRCAAFDVFPD